MPQNTTSGSFDLRAEDNLTFTLAAAAGNMEIVELLLSVANLRTRNSQAARNGRADVVKRPIAVSNCGYDLNRLQKQPTQHHADFFKHCLHEYVAQQRS